MIKEFGDFNLKDIYIFYIKTSFDFIKNMRNQKKCAFFTFFAPQTKTCLFKIKL